MEWRYWEPIYRTILADMGYDERMDSISANILSNLVDNQRTPKSKTLVEMLGQHVSICGFGPSLEKRIDAIDPSSVTIAAGSSTEIMMDVGIRPSMIVTDLDGDIGSQIEASSKGTISFIHAHGDNMDLLKRYLPRFEGPVVPTTQCKPIGAIYNYGGFTDGDRAAFMAVDHGVKRIDLIGWDFEHPRQGVGDVQCKLKKLKWAKELLESHICTRVEVRMI